MIRLVLFLLLLPTLVWGEVLPFTGNGSGSSDGSSGSTSFIGLTDVPANFTGAATDVLAVNAAGNAVQFVDAVSAATANTFVKRDANADASFNDLTAVDLTATTVTMVGTTAGLLQLNEATANGSNYISLQSPDARTTNLILRLPTADPAGGQTLSCGTPSSNESTCSWSTPTKSIWFGAGALSTDATNCAAPTEQTLNSGVKLWAFSCADSASSIFYGSIVMPDGWDAGTLTFELTLFHATTETITFAGDFSAQCHGAGEVLDSTWGSAVAADVSITTANQQVNATSAAVTPSGTCAAGDFLAWRYVVDNVNFSTNAANSKVLGVKMEYTASLLSD